MNETANTFLLVGDTFTPAMLLRQLKLVYSVYGPLTKTNEIKKRKKLVEEEHMKICWPKIACNMTHLMEEMKNLTKAFLRDIAFSVVNNQNLDAYRRGSALVVYKLSYKKRKEPGTMTTSKEATVTSKGNNLTKLLLKNDTENEALANKEQLPKDSKQNKEK